MSPDAFREADHPFEYPYIGLGWLSTPLIFRFGDTWTADYRDLNDRAYLQVQIKPEYVEIREYDLDLHRVGLTRERTLSKAILLHTLPAIDGNPSRFLERLAQTGRLPIVIPRQAQEGVTTAFAPAMVIGRVFVPTPVGGQFRPPRPGRVAKYLGFDFDEDEGSPVPGVLITLREGQRVPEVQTIELHTFTRPCILVPELAFAIRKATGRLSGAEWRPFLEVDLSGRLGRAWPQPPRIGKPSGGHLQSYEIIELEAPLPSPDSAAGTPPDPPAPKSDLVEASDLESADRGDRPIAGDEQGRLGATAESREDWLKRLGAVPAPDSGAQVWLVRWPGPRLKSDLVEVSDLETADRGDPVVVGDEDGRPGTAGGGEVHSVGDGE